jgi:hypothetical protein
MSATPIEVSHFRAVFSGDLSTQNEILFRRWAITIRVRQFGGSGADRAFALGTAAG